MLLTQAGCLSYLTGNTMGIYDRDYARPYQDQHYSMGSGFKGMPPVVKWLLIINFAIYIAERLLFEPLFVEDPDFTRLDLYFSVLPITRLMAIQLWRVITYQFLHGSPMHLAFNLLFLYFMIPFV